LAFRGDGAALGDGAVEVLRPALAGGRGGHLVVHNVKQLAHIAGRYGMIVGTNVLDTGLASFLVDPVRCIPHTLDQVAKEYVQRGVPSWKSLVGSGQSERKPSDLPVATVAAHMAQIADVLLALDPVLRGRLEEAGQRAHYESVERPLALVLGRMEAAGIAVDEADLGRMSDEFTSRKAEVEQRIYALAGRTFNVGSTKQLADVLFTELKLPVVKKTKTGYSTDAEVLERLASKHEIAQQILAQRELAKLINTYTDVLRGAINRDTNRIHATFQQTTGVSGRLITTDPDLQQVFTFFAIGTMRQGERLVECDT
jgi:DNA polymerase-1